jgi:Kdo2-lipid IVA lauroyltransferase/acyltransferase
LPLLVLLAVFRLLAWMPLPIVHAAGALLGWLTYLVSTSYRSRLRDNLRRAGIDSAAVRRAAIAAAGRQALEAPWLWLRDGRDVAAVVQESPPGCFARLLAQPGPLLLLTPHLGGFEAVAQYYATLAIARDRPLTALYRVPRKQALRELIDRRARPGLVLAPADLSGVRLLMRALKQRQTAGILPDQVPSAGDGVWAPFFGDAAYTMTLPARLAVAAQARVVFVLCERLPRGAGYRLSLAPLTEPLCGDAARDAAVLNAALERLIRQQPAQYLWGYNRYKAPPGVAPVA